MSVNNPLDCLRHLFHFFTDSRVRTVPPFEIASSHQVPPPFQELLVHKHHMTVTLEKYFGLPVALKVLGRNRGSQEYARLIQLLLEGTNQVVEFGIFHMDLSVCRAELQAEILEERTPLGHILMRHDVLRIIEPWAFLRFPPGPQVASWFEMESPYPTYGRLARIVCDGSEAIELLEVVRPEPAKLTHRTDQMPDALSD